MTADGQPEAGDVFSAIYETAHWEGGSGQGSRPDVTAPYRNILAHVIGASDVRSVVDAGCGDWEFSKLVDWTGVTYTGVDVVPAVIAANQAAFATDNVRFLSADFSTGDLPAADALLCKDVLQHWPTARISAFLRAVKGRYRYLLITNDVSSVHWPADRLNCDIRLGEWRTVDLERPPFALRADWSADYDVRGEWTKRAVLSVRPTYLPVARVRRRSALRRLLHG